MKQPPIPNGTSPEPGLSYPWLIFFFTTPWRQEKLNDSSQGKFFRDLPRQVGPSGTTYYSHIPLMVPSGKPTHQVRVRLVVEIPWFFQFFLKIHPRYSQVILWDFWTINSYGLIFFIDVIRKCVSCIGHGGRLIKTQIFGIVPWKTHKRPPNELARCFFFWPNATH